MADEVAEEGPLRELEGGCDGSGRSRRNAFRMKRGERLEGRNTTQRLAAGGAD